MISQEKFINDCAAKFEEWFNNFKLREYDKCNRIARTHIDTCRIILKGEKWNSEEANNITYISGVLFSGLNEFVRIAELTRGGTWPMDNKRTEEIWKLMWNSLERFEFCSPYFVAQQFDWIKERLEELREDFVTNFGHGFYASPEILIKKEICSICGKDTRACLHIGGNLYNGEMCYNVPKDIQMRTVSVVTVPRDPRCRIWPWNMKEDRTFQTAIIVLFTIDDWLDEPKLEHEN